jgi:regulation of enolase protein 1 (concanavalin A-like superfamily)
MSTTINVPGVPFPLTPSAGSSWNIEAQAASISVAAPPRSDIFIDPRSDGPVDAASQLNAATLMGTPPDRDFQLRARVTVDFASTFDAGALLLWIDERHWAKLCFEFSPAGEPMIVTVVSRGVADDANGFVVEGRTVWLRVSRIDRAYAYHASRDGKHWQMIRYFKLESGPATATLGFEAQSPTGDGCTVRFDEIAFSVERLAELRDGS